MKTFALSAAALAICAAPAFAKPLDARVVAADAVWMVHLDVEAAVNSSIGRAMLDNPGQFGINAGDFDEVNTELGVDVRKDLHSVTVYGATEDEHSAVIVVTTTAALDGAIDRLMAKNQGLAKVVEDGRTFYTWTEDNNVAWIAVRPGPLPAERIVVHAEDKAHLIAGLNVMDSKSPSLIGSANPNAAKAPKPGSIIFAAASGFGDAIKNSGASQIVRNAEGGVLDIGESGQQMYADVVITTTTPADATNIAQVVQGLLAMGRMFAQGQQEMAPLVGLISSVNVTPSGNLVNMSCRCDSAHLLDAMRAAHEMDVEHNHAHKHGHHAGNPNADKDVDEDDDQN